MQMDGLQRNTKLLEEDGRVADHLKDTTKKPDLVLPRGDMKVLEAEDKDYKRGMLVKLIQNGGYEMHYWYKEHKPAPVEVLVDGVSVKKDAKKVTMKFHPDDYYDESVERDADFKMTKRIMPDGRVKMVKQGRKETEVSKKSSREDEKMEEQLTLEDLRKWFGKGKKGDWVRVGTDGEIKGSCAREPGEGKPKCMPRSRAHSMDKDDRASAARRKRRADPDVDRPGTGNKPIMVKTVKEFNEGARSMAMADKDSYKKQNLMGTDALLKKYLAGTPGQGDDPKGKEKVDGRVKGKTIDGVAKLQKPNLSENVGYVWNLCTESFDKINITEAEKDGKKVSLGKPFRTPGGPKKFAVYVKNEKGNVVKVTFGDPNLSIKRDDPARRKSFRARHNCDNPGPRTKARYWSCYQWRSGAKVED